MEHAVSGKNTSVEVLHRASSSRSEWVRQSYETRIDRSLRWITETESRDWALEVWSNIEVWRKVALIWGLHAIPLDTNCTVTRKTELWVEIVSPDGIKSFIPISSLHHIGPALPDIPKGKMLPWHPLLRWIDDGWMGVLSELHQYDETGRMLQTIVVWEKVWLMAKTYPLPVDTNYTVKSITWEDILLEDVFGNSCRVPLWNISDLHVRYRDPNMPVIDRDEQYASSLREKNQKNGIRK